MGSNEQRAEKLISTVLLQFVLTSCDFISVRGNKFFICYLVNQSNYQSPLLFDIIVCHLCQNNVKSGLYYLYTSCICFLQTHREMLGPIWAHYTLYTHYMHYGTWVIHSSQGPRLCRTCTNLDINACFSGGTPKQASLLAKSAEALWKSVDPEAPKGWS